MWKYTSGYYNVGEWVMFNFDTTTIYGIVKSVVPLMNADRDTEYEVESGNSDYLIYTYHCKVVYVFSICHDLMSGNPSNDSRYLRLEYSI